MSKIKLLDATRREGTGKGAARAARRDGRVPAVIYGGGQDPVAISLDFKTTNKLIYAGHFLTTVFEISVGADKIKAIPRDYQLEPVKDSPIHVDFLRLSDNSRVRVEVPVHFSNQDTAPGIKKGGSLNIVNHTIEMLVPWDNIPEFLTIDLGTLDLNESVHLGQIILPEGAKPTSTDKDLTIVTISAPVGGKEEAAPAAAPAAAAKPAAKPAAKK